MCGPGGVSGSRTQRNGPFPDPSRDEEGAGAVWSPFCRWNHDPSRAARSGRRSGQSGTRPWRRPTVSTWTRPTVPGLDAGQGATPALPLWAWGTSLPITPRTRAHARRQNRSQGRPAAQERKRAAVQAGEPLRDQRGRPAHPPAGRGRTGLSVGEFWRRRLMVQPQAGANLRRIQWLPVHRGQHRQEPERLLRPGRKPPLGQVPADQQFEIVFLPAGKHFGIHHSAIRVASAQPEIVQLTCLQFGEDERAHMHQAKPARERLRYVAQQRRRNRTQQQEAPISFASRIDRTAQAREHRRVVLGLIQNDQPPVRGQLVPFGVQPYLAPAGLEIKVDARELTSQGGLSALPRSEDGDGREKCELPADFRGKKAVEPLLQNGNQFPDCKDGE